MPFLDTILDLVFPVKCIGCGRSGLDLCFDCLADAPAAERESAEWIFPIYDYRHPLIKKSIRLLKYKGKKRLARVFAEVLYEKIMEELSELGPLENFREPVLIPIPLSRRRYRERGFNQAELLCRELMKINRGSGDVLPGIPFQLATDILHKPQETEHQARIKDRRKRLANIKNSFAVKNPEKLKNTKVILIDDILTTGATLSEARKLLRAHGARRVIAFTVAH